LSEVRIVNVVKVGGAHKKHKVFMYALSTCAWCKRTKQFLKDNDVEYEYVDVDLESPEEWRKITRELASRKSHVYPTLLVDGRRLIKGFNLDEIREALGL